MENPMGSPFKLYGVSRQHIIKRAFVNINPPMRHKKDEKDVGKEVLLKSAELIWLPPNFIAIILSLLF